LKYTDTVLLIFAKAPVPGDVNTRLIPHIGIDKATRLQEELIHSRLKTFTEAGMCHVQLWCSPDCNGDFFNNCREVYGVDLFNQDGVDLGARMSAAIKQALEKFKHVVVIGTDAPALGVAQVEEAIKVLCNSKDIVMVPAEDGGYVLIGMNNHHSEIFLTVPWGSDRVLRKTRGNIIALGLKYHELDECWDIDRPEDYDRYLEFMK
jgi:rSAM/selenodomain-associated transferase 1